MVSSRAGVDDCWRGRAAHASDGDSGWRDARRSRERSAARVSDRSPGPASESCTAVNRLGIKPRGTRPAPPVEDPTGVPRAIPTGIPIGDAIADGRPQSAKWLLCLAFAHSVGANRHLPRVSYPPLKRWACQWTLVLPTRECDRRERTHGTLACAQ